MRYVANAIVAMNQPDSKPRTHASALVAIVLLGCIFLVYAPLMLAGIESLIFGTRRVEDFCELIGVHDLLSTIYKKTVFLFL